MRTLLLVIVACALAPWPAAARSAGLSPRTVNAADGPVAAGSSRPAIARLQILLDRAGASPGAIDGRWGANTAKAVAAFQAREELPETGEADRETLRRLKRAAGRGAPVVERKLTEKDVRGPFTEIPEDVYAQAELDCLCYRSLSEKLAERFHTTPALLAELNPGVELDSLSAGDRLHVPGVERQMPRGRVDRLVVHKQGGFLRALDANGKLLLHLPVTVGADFSESPDGTLEIEAIALDPDWHFKPAILKSVDSTLEDAVLPAGPNNPVGVVWIALSKPSYGIHGTDAPETIGYASSNGCVRLTNWDVLFLAAHVREGLRVEFTD